MQFEEPLKLAEEYRKRGWEGVARYIELCEVSSEEITTIILLSRPGFRDVLIELYDSFGYFSALLKEIDARADQSREVIVMLDQSLALSNDCITSTVQ